MIPLPVLPSARACSHTSCGNAVERQAGGGGVRRTAVGRPPSLSFLFRQHGRLRELGLGGLTSVGLADDLVRCTDPHFQEAKEATSSRAILTQRDAGPGLVIT